MNVDRRHIVAEQGDHTQVIAGRASTELWHTPGTLGKIRSLDGMSNQMLRGCHRVLWVFGGTEVIVETRGAARVRYGTLVTRKGLNPNGERRSSRDEPRAEEASNPSTAVPVSP
jgi:hypothetical protein